VPLSPRLHKGVRCCTLPVVLTTAEILEGRSRFEAVSGLYRNTRHGDYFWFAFRRPADWVQLDASTKSNGALYVEVDGARKGVLIVAGAAAAESSQGAPGHRRLHSMVQHGMTWPGAPAVTEPTVWAGREALRCRWQAEVKGEAIFDRESGLPVRTEWPDEVVELTDLRFDTQVDRTVFEPPDRTTGGWRGGVAYIVRKRMGGETTSSWEPRSGPGSLHIPGPSSTTVEEAMAWARERTDDIQISEEDDRP
jgi:hypothetical protein